MTYAQPRMAALLDVQRRSAEAINQEVSKPLFRAWKIVRRIQRTQ